MSEIYGRTELVLVWLGPSDLSSEGTRNCLNGFGQVVFKLIHNEGWDNVVKYNPRLPELYQRLGEDCRPMRLGMAYNRFFRRSYFRRTWILQEISLAKRLILLCGDRLFDLDEILNFDIYTRRASRWPMRAVDFSNNLLPGLQSISLTRSLLADRSHLAETARSYARIFGIMNQGALLLAFLDLSRGFQASRQSDKIFSLLGILKCLTGPSHDENAITIDYNVPAADL